VLRCRSTAAQDWSDRNVVGQPQRSVPDQTGTTPACCLHSQRSNRWTAGRKTHPSCQLGYSENHLTDRAVRQNNFRRTKNWRQTTALRQLYTDRTRTTRVRHCPFHRSLRRRTGQNHPDRHPGVRLVTFDTIGSTRTMPATAANRGVCGCTHFTSTDPGNTSVIRTGRAVQHSSHWPAGQLANDKQQRCVSAARAHAGQSFEGGFTFSGRPVARNILQEMGGESSICVENPGFREDLPDTLGNWTSNCNRDADALCR
jgi:hypothetical protein